MSFLKRLFVIFLTSVLLLTCGITSFAEEDADVDGETAEEEKRFDVTAPFAIITNPDTGTVLYEKNADYSVFCGFLPRLMTCIMLVESGIDLETKIQITKEMSVVTHDQSSADLRTGDKISLYDLMQCILVSNSQEAAIAIATTLGGSVSQFVVNMNLRAREIGAENTSFTNVTGQYTSTTKQSTTVKDIATICTHALTLDYIEDISNYRYVEISVNGRTRQLFTKNSLVDKNSTYYYKKASGLCISGSSTAGYALASVTEVKTTRILSVAVTYDTIGSVYEDVTSMLKYSLEEYAIRTLIQKNAPVSEIPVVFGKERDTLILVAENTVTASLPSSVKDDEIVVTVVVPDDVNAPVEKGTPLGTVTYEFEGRNYGTVNLIAQSDISLDIVAQYTAKINGFFTNKYVVAAIVLILAIIVFYSVVLFAAAKKQKRKEQSRKRDRINKMPK